MREGGRERRMRVKEKREGDGGNEDREGLRGRERGGRGGGREGRGGRREREWAREVWKCVRGKRRYI